MHLGGLMSQNGKLYNLVLEGEKLTEDKNKEMMSKLIEESNNKWKKLDDLVNSLEVLSSIKEYLKIKKPSDWWYNFNEIHKIDASIIKDGFLKINLHFIYNTNTNEWKFNNRYELHCSDWGLVRFNNLSEALAYAYKHLS